MVNWDAITKNFKYVGIEIIAVISFIVLVQEVFNIDLNLTFIIYILTVAVFIDSMIRLGLNALHRIRLSLTLDSKMCKEYTIEQLKTELSSEKTATEQGREVAAEVKPKVVEAAKTAKDKITRTEKKEIKAAEKAAEKEAKIQAEKEAKKKELEEKLAELLGDEPTQENDPEDEE